MRQACRQGGHLKSAIVALLASTVLMESKRHCLRHERPPGVSRLRCEEASRRQPEHSQARAQRVRECSARSRVQVLEVPAHSGMLWARSALQQVSTDSSLRGHVAPCQAVCSREAGRLCQR